MIFKAVEKENGKVSLGTSFGGIKGLKNFFKKQNILSNSDMDAVKAYNDEFVRLSDKVSKSGINVSKSTIAQKAAGSTMATASTKAQDIVAKSAGNTVDTGSLVKSSKAASMGMKAVAAIGNAVADIGIDLAIQGIISGVDYFTHKDQIEAEELANTKSIVLQTTDEIKSLNDELISTNDKIAELQSLTNTDTLSIVDENELSTLKETRNELERKIALKHKEQTDNSEELLEKAQKTVGKEEFYFYQTYNDDGEELSIKKSGNVINKLQDYLNSYDIVMKHNDKERIDFDNFNEAISRDAESIGTLIDAYNSLKNLGRNLTEEEQAEYDAAIKAQDAYLLYSYNLKKNKERFGGLNKEQQRSIIYDNLLEKGLEKQDANSVLKYMPEDDLGKYYDFDFSFPLPNRNDYKTSEEYGKAFAEAWKNGVDLVTQNTNMGNAKLSFKKTWDSIGATQLEEKNKLLEFAKAGKLTEKQLEKSSIADVFKDAGISIEEATRKINKFADNTKQLNVMSTGIKAIKSAYDEKKNSKDHTVSFSTLESMYDTLGIENWDDANKKVWENYKKHATDGKKSMAGMEKAQNQLASSFVNSNNFLANLDDTNIEYYKTLLSEMGVANANEIANNALNRSKAISALESENLSDMTSEEITSLIEEKAKTEEVAAAMRAYAFEKLYANGNALDTTEDITQLMDLLEAFGIAAPAIKRYRDYLNGDYNTSEPGGMDPEYLRNEAEKEGNRVNKKLNKIITRRTKVAPKGTDNGDDPETPKTPKTIVSKETKQEIDWIDRRLTRINSKLNLIKAAYENIASTVKGANLDKVVSKQNSNLDRQIKLLKRLENSSSQAASKYAKKANSVKISKNKKTDQNLKNLVKSEAAIGKKTSYKTLVKKYGQKTADKITKYRNYYDKSQSAKQSAKEYKKQQTDAKIQQHQNLADKYQSRIDKQAARSEVTNKSKAKDEDLTLQHSAKQKEKHIKEQIKSTNKLYYEKKKIAQLEGNDEEVAKLEAERRKAVIDLQIQSLQNYADENEASYNLKATEASMTTDYKKKNALSKEGIKYLKEQYEKLIKIAEKEGDVTKQKQIQLEMNEQLNDGSKGRVQNVIDDYENRLIGNNRQMQVWNNAASLAEAKGKTVSAKFYDQMAKTAEESAEKHREGLAAAWDQYYEEMETNKDNPSFFTSQQWYDTISAINSEADAWEQDRISAEKYKQQAIQANWEIEDSAKQAIDHLNDEAETYKTIFGYKDMYDKNGVLTDAGTATFALDVYGIENNTDKFKKINNEIDNLNELFKADKISPEEYNKRMQELRDDAMSTVETIYSLRDAMKSLIEDGLNAEMDALNEMIDKVKSNLSDASSLREYQKNIEKQTKNIASLERQISARSGDMSEKGRADVQKLKVQLEEAKSELEDTEYDKYIEDQERILDDMSDDFQKYLDAQLDQVDGLLNQIITSVQNGDVKISDTLMELGNTIGVDLSKIRSENLSEYSSTGKTDAEGVYDNTVDSYNKSADEEYKASSETPVMNTDENKGQFELNALANDSAYQKTSSWLKSKGFSDNDVNRMYTSLGTDNAQAIFTGIQGAGGNPSAEQIFDAYGKSLNQAHLSGRDTPDAFSSYKETDAYANAMKAEEEKKKAEIAKKEQEQKDKEDRNTSNNNKIEKIAETFTKVREYKNAEEYSTDALFNYGAQKFAKNNGKDYKKYLSMENVKKIDGLVKGLVDVDTGKPMFNTSSGEKIYDAICKLDKQYGGAFKNAVKNRTTSLSVGGFSKGGIIDSKTMSKIADNNGDDAWVTVKSGEGILSPLDTQNFLAFTDTVGKLNNSRLLETGNMMSRRSISANNNVYGGVNIHLDGSDIKDFATFETAFQNAAKNSTKLRNTILDVATSGMTGDTNAFMRR